MSPVFRHGALRLYLLKLLSEQPRHGYEVISLLEDRFMGLYSPSAGTVYPRLARLEADGLVEHDEADGRKVYRLTDAGREELERSTEALRTLEADLTHSVTELANDVRSQVRASVRDLRDELKQAAREVRRETRVHSRRGFVDAHEEVARLAGDLAAARRGRSEGRGASELAREAVALTRDLLTAGRGADEASVEAAREVLRRARTDVMAALRGEGGTATP